MQVAGMGRVGRMAGWEALRRAKGSSVVEGAHRGLPVLERTKLDDEASGRAPGKLPRLE